MSNMFHNPLFSSKCILKICANLQSLHLLLPLPPYLIDQSFFDHQINLKILSRWKRARERIEKIDGGKLSITNQKNQKKQKKKKKNKKGKKNRISPPGWRRKNRVSTRSTRIKERKKKRRHVWREIKVDQLGVHLRGGGRGGKKGGRRCRWLSFGSAISETITILVPVGGGRGFGSRAMTAARKTDLSVG